MIEYKLIKGYSLNESKSMIVKYPKYISLEDIKQYSNVSYIIEIIDTNVKVFAVLILKNEDGLEPIIKISEKVILIGYECNVSIISLDEFKLIKHINTNSLVYDFIFSKSKIISVQELDVLLFDCYGNIFWDNSFCDIINKYYKKENYIFIETLDKRRYKINISDGKKIEL